jgi:hypothetical protein
MAGKIKLIIYQLNGLPVNLTNEGRWRSAICNGELRRDTEVEVHSESEPAFLAKAGLVPGLRRLFAERDREAAEEAATAAGREEAPAPAAEPGRPPEAEGEGPDGDDRPRSKICELEPVEPPAPVDPATDPATRYPAIAALVVLVVVLAALFVFHRRPPRIPSIEGPARYYVVITTTEVREVASRHGDPKHMLQRNSRLKGVPVERAEGKWLRIVDGPDNGFFVPTEGLELANAADSE